MTLLVILWTVAVVGMPVAVFAAGRRVVRGRYGARARSARDSRESTEPADGKAAVDRREPAPGSSRG